MAAPSLISTRRFSGTTRLRLQVLFARAWEALADTYHLQAAEFVRRLKTQLPIDEALDRFFREVGVPAAMRDTVRARALIALATIIEEEAEEPEETAENGWNPLRPDQLIGALRRRALRARSFAQVANGKMPLSGTPGCTLIFPGERAGCDRLDISAPRFDMPS